MLFMIQPKHMIPRFSPTMKNRYLDRRAFQAKKAMKPGMPEKAKSGYIRRDGTDRLQERSDSQVKYTFTPTRKV